MTCEPPNFMNFLKKCDLVMPLKNLLFCTNPQTFHQPTLHLYIATPFPCLSPPESGRGPGWQRCGGCGRSARRSGGQRDGVDPPAADVTPAAGSAQQPLLPAERRWLLGPARRLHQDQAAGRRAGPQRGNRKVYVVQTWHAQHVDSGLKKWCLQLRPLQWREFMVQ